MSRALTYIIGEPGVGKSTLVDRLTRGLMARTVEEPFAMRWYLCGVTELGRRREAFSGTDALPLNVQPPVELWLREAGADTLVIAEGDRLANSKLFTAAQRAGYELTVYHLFGPEVAAERRIKRGSEQDATWLKGRQTKVENLALEWLAIELDARLRPSQLVEAMSDRVSRTLKEMQE